ncbi:MAG: hypothetical protein H0X00_03315 [Sporichthya sp.]|nr:hypothetical protein [Sporichthya sp.]
MRGSNNVPVRHASVPTSFAFLFVCTGNICRSPFAELLTAHLLSGRLGSEVRGFHFASAGVGAVVGSPMHPDTRNELAAWGLADTYAGGFLARQLEAPMVDEADVVLTATVEHRTAVLGLCPPALPRTFTLLEFARLITDLDPGPLPLDPIQRAHALVRHAPTQRGTTRSAKPADDSISDPMGRRRKAHHTAAQQVTQAVTAIAEAIAP